MREEKKQKISLRCEEFTDLMDSTTDGWKVRCIIWEVSGQMIAVVGWG